MAKSNIPITEGSGTNVSTRTNASAENMQVVMLGIDDSDSVLVATPSGLPVRTTDDVISVTPSLSTGVYTAGDLLWDSVEIPNAVSVTGSVSTLMSLVLSDYADQKAPLIVVFANANTDFGTVNNAPSPNAAAMATVIGHVEVVASDYLDLGSYAEATIRNIGLPLKAAAGATSLYVAAINGANTPDYVNANDIVLQIGLVKS